MGFTTNCFIKKSSPKLISKLREMGYIIMKSTQRANCLRTTCGCVVGRVHVPYPLTYSHAVDCGENEDLFLAIAALRNDSDKYQWFTDGQIWFKSDADCHLGNSTLFHKASINEIRERFR